VLELTAEELMAELTLELTTEELQG